MARVKAGKPVIDVLNEILTAELTAINQYFLHAKMLENWGYERLAHTVRDESIDEMKHADAVIERVLYLDGVPNVQRLGRVRIGETVREQFELDLALEQEAIPRLNDAIKLCRDEEDNGTRALLEKILVDEEEHLDWLETQLSLIAQVGEPGYLAEQIKRRGAGARIHPGHRHAEQAAPRLQDPLHRLSAPHPGRVRELPAAVLRLDGLDGHRGRHLVPGK